MICYYEPQGSQLWHDRHIYVVTASDGESIITPKKWEPTSGAARRRYALRKLTERILGMSLDQAVTPAMIHGKYWEPKAREAYEFANGVDVEPVGFCTTDDGRIGASPDGFVGATGGLEIKCPEQPQNHVGYLLSPETLRDEYWVQTQFQLFVTGREWTDLISYFQGIPMACIRITPHAEFHKKLDAALKQFLQDLDNLAALAEARGVVFPAPDDSEPQPSVIADALGVSPEEVEEIFAMRRKEEQGNG